MPNSFSWNPVKSRPVTSGLNMEAVKMPERLHAKNI